MKSVFYLQHSACQGEPAEWAKTVFPALPCRYPPAKYRTRRLDRMSVDAVEGALRALAERGIPPEEYKQYGVVSLSHNGPCIYSEEFYKQLSTENDPALVSPMLFTESVLNIIGTHVALAIKTQAPVLSWNTGIHDFFCALLHLSMLHQSGHFNRALFCAAEEFSPLCRDAFRRCKEYPGQSFCSATTILLTATAPLPGDNFRISVSPRYSIQEGTTHLAADRSTEYIRSAFSTTETDIEGISLMPPLQSILSGMETEQAFLSLRCAELAACCQRSREKQCPCVLLQTDADSLQYIQIDFIHNDPANAHE